jgi:hypothetical protein
VLVVAIIIPNRMVDGDDNLNDDVCQHPSIRPSPSCLLSMVASEADGMTWWCIHELSNTVLVECECGGGEGGRER